MQQKEAVRKMFDNIAGSYDSLNHIMSLDADKSWRKTMLGKLGEGVDGRPLKVLDLACGTGDSTIAIARGLPRAKVTGLDLSEGMLKVMEGKVEKEGLGDRITAVRGDGENLPFSESSFDRVAIAFGIRNFQNREQGLAEMLRVLVPGGRLVVLELSLPEQKVLRALFKCYFLHILPFIGGLISGNRGAYRYLPESVLRFPSREVFLDMMKSAGFSSVGHKALTFGICRMYWGEKA